MEELLALRHDEREFRRRWMARVDAWCKGLREVKDGTGSDRAASVIESVMKELADIGEPEGSPLAIETRERLAAASRQGVSP